MRDRLLRAVSLTVRVFGVGWLIVGFVLLGLWQCSNDPGGSPFMLFWPLANLPFLVVNFVGFLLVVLPGAGAISLADRISKQVTRRRA